MKSLTPLQAIRKKCLWCMAGNADQVNKCQLEGCPLWDYRFGKKPNLNNGKELLTPIKSIKKYCFECSNFNKADVRNCDIPHCVLHPFRLGKNPNRAGICGKGFKTRDRSEIVN